MKKLSLIITVLLLVSLTLVGCDSDVLDTGGNGNDLTDEAYASVAIDKVVFGPSTIYTVNVKSVSNLSGAARFAILNMNALNTAEIGEELTRNTEEDSIALYILDSNNSLLASTVISDNSIDFNGNNFEGDLILEPKTADQSIEVEIRELSEERDNEEIRVDSDLGIMQVNTLELKTLNGEEIMAHARLEPGEYRRWVPLIIGGFDSFPDGIFIINDAGIEYNFAWDNRTRFNEIVGEKLLEVDYKIADVDLYYKMPGRDLIDAKTGDEVNQTESQQIYSEVTTLYDADHPNGRTTVLAMADVEVDNIPMDASTLYRVTVHEVIGLQGVEGFSIFELEDEYFKISAIGETQDNDTMEDYINLYLFGEFDDNGEMDGEYAISFTVRSVTEGELPINGATVSVAGRSRTTNSEGFAKLTGFEQGVYEYSISATGYNSASGEINIINSDISKDIYLAPEPDEGNRVHFSGILFYDEIQQSWTEIPYLANGHYDAYGLNTDDFVGSGDYHNNNLAFPNAVATTFDGIAIDEGTRLIIYSQEGFKGEILIDVYGPMLINNIDFMGSSQVSDYLTKTFQPQELNDLFPPEVRKWSDSSMHNWSYGSCRIRTSSDPDFNDDFPPLVEAGSTATYDVDTSKSEVEANPAGYRF